MTVRKFYEMHPDFRTGGVLGVELQNMDVIAPGWRTIGPPPGRRGFPDYPEAPRFQQIKKNGRLPRDLDQSGEYWLVSDRTKKVFESVDPDGFAFAPCEMLLSDGQSGPVHWLCDIVRVLDAVDEPASRLKIVEDNITGAKRYDLMVGASLAFKAGVVDSVEVFRLAFSQPVVICSQSLKDACKAAGLKGIAFKDVAKY